MTIMTKMEENKIKFCNAYLTEVHRNFKLTKQIEKYENQPLTTQMTVEAKQRIQHNINVNIIELWLSFQIIFQQDDLVQRVKPVVEKTKDAIKQKPGEAHKIIKMVNSKTRYELEEVQIQDKTCTIMEVKGILTKNNLMIQLENKCEELDLQVKIFNIELNVLQENGLVALKAYNGKLIPLENYQVQL